MKMKNAFLAATAVMMFGLFGVAQAQSEAMEKTYESNEKPLETESTSESAGESNSDTGTGHSEASDKSINAVDEETNKATAIDQDEDMQELDSEGHSEAEGETKKQK